MPEDSEVVKLDYTVLSAGQTPVELHHRISADDPRWPTSIPFQAQAKAIVAALGPLHLLGPKRAVPLVARIAATSSGRLVDVGPAGCSCLWDLSPVATLALVVGFPTELKPGATLLSVILDFDVLTDPDLELAEIAMLLERRGILAQLAKFASERA